MKYKKCIYVALDGMTEKQALLLTKKLMTSKYSEIIAGFKIHDLWDNYGKIIVNKLKRIGAPEIWLDYKLHDTPNTVVLRAKIAKESGIDIISMHASAGLRALKNVAKINIKVVAITVITSLDKKDIKYIYGIYSQKIVRKLYDIARGAKVWGVVCSKEDVKNLSKINKELKIIVPGIKLNGKTDFNQKRVGTPKKTIQNGADYIVIGSEITKSKNPVSTFRRIALSL